MSTIYTTSRCITVKEDYDVIQNIILEAINAFIELTELTTISSGDFPDYEFDTKERKVLIQIKHIVELNA